MINRYISIIFLCIVFVSPIRGQYIFFNTNEPQKLDLKFAKHSVEAKKGKTIFNVIKITNQSSQTQTFNLHITVPSGWQTIGREIQELTLSPLDSTFIPIRVAIGEKVRGDIGYSIIATLTDGKGNTIKNEYSFIKIPREVDMRVKFLTRFEYLDQQTGLAPIRIKIENKGNREEMVSFSIEGDNYIAISEARLHNYNFDMNIPPYSDSTISLNVYLNKNIETSKEIFKVVATAKTIDSSFNGTVWFRNLTSNYENFIPESRRVLIAELFGRGLFSNYAKPSYASIIQGNILLNKKREINFFYNNDNTYPYNNLYLYNRMWLGYRTKRFYIQIGDINKSIETSLFGRGGSLNVEFKKVKFEISASKRIVNPQNNIGAEVEFSPTQHFGIILGGVYNNSLNENFDSKLGLVGTKFSILKDLKVGIQTTFNQVQFGRSQDSIVTKTALGYTGFANYSKNSLSISARYKIGEKYLNSSYNGRSEFLIQSTYKFSNQSTLQHYAIDNRTSPGDYRTYQIIEQPFTNFHKQLFTYGFSPSSKFYLFGGPGFEFNSSDIFPVIKRGQDYFSTFVYNLNLGLRLKGQRAGSSLTTQVFSGFVNVAHKPTIFIDTSFNIASSKNRFNYQFFSINLKQPNWGFQAMYTNGPRSIYEQFSWYYGSRTTRLLRVMPYFDSFIYKEQIRLMVNVSYSNDLVSKSSYSNITSQLFWYLPKDWQIRFLNVYTIQSRITTTETVERFQNMYFEASVKKEFGIQQPTIKFYDLKIQFFKDYNGNRVKNDNEPGIKNVLISIQRIDENSNDFPDFTSGELLSNQYGEILFEKIPAGRYQLSYNPIGNEAGTFSKSDVELIVNVNKNSSFDIPFVEKNKVFGKIILNRSRLSGLGRLDISNIRITATDSRGNTYSTLTDKNGGFTIFAPVTDEYIVNINNIFYENFDLRQNNFRVQFNGYKQFEVNFVFDEKIRRINFSPSTQDNLAEGVLQIRRTNLRGTVKDATSLKPLRAKINLVNTKNNSISSSIYSNPQTGDYALSFMAEDIYVLEILADDYWYFSENLTLNQVTTFMNVNKDILLKQITIGSKIELNIKFLEINKAILGPETVAELNRLLRILRDNSNIKVEVQGHCDDLEALSNPQIAEERAKAVAKYLIENGFNNLQVRGFGNTVPIAPNDTEENRTLNRRVELEVISK